MTGLGDRVALVTGGASGIGLAAARRFAREGARVVVVDIREDAGKAAAEEVGGRFIAADVGLAGSWTRVAEVVARDFERLDVVLLNAGRGVGDGDIRALSEDLYRRVLAVNLDGVVLGTRALVPQLEAAGGGHILIMSSTAALGPGSDPIYALTKAGQLGFMRDIAPRLEPLGIAINALLPHVVDTPLLPQAIAISCGRPVWPCCPRTRWRTRRCTRSPRARPVSPGCASRDSRRSATSCPRCRRRPPRSEQAGSVQRAAPIKERAWK
jgi:NAD(P)-dependent dehydrogenase (short-subunit alcohol dehydrogenase family)